MTNSDSISVLEGVCAGVVPANESAACDALERLAARLTTEQWARASRLPADDVVELERWVLVTTATPGA